MQIEIRSTLYGYKLSKGITIRDAHIRARNMLMEMANASVPKLVTHESDLIGMRLFTTSPAYLRLEKDCGTQRNDVESYKATWPRKTAADAQEFDGAAVTQRAGWSLRTWCAGGGADQCRASLPLPFERPRNFQMEQTFERRELFIGQWLFLYQRAQASPQPFKLISSSS